MNNISDFLDFQWSQEGFLWKLRKRVYDKQEGQKLLSYLSGCEPNNIRFTKRFVRLIWMIPLFLEWRIIDYTRADLLPEDELIELKKLCRAINGEVERILGMP